MTRLTLFLICLCIFSSCDPGFVVVLSNQSTKDRNIVVIVSDKRKLISLDSIPIVDSSNPPKRFNVPVSKDINTSSYSFDLASRKNAVLQQGIGGPDLSEKIIVDLSDTILLSDERRVTKKKNGISTAVTVKID